MNFWENRKNVPSIGNPNLKISGSYFGESMSYTDEGPPDIMIALKPWSLIYWAVVASGKSSDSTCNSRTFRSMTYNKVYMVKLMLFWNYKNFLPFHIELQHQELLRDHWMFFHFRQLKISLYSFFVPRYNTVKKDIERKKIVIMHFCLNHKNFLMVKIFSLTKWALLLTRTAEWERLFYVAYLHKI